MDEFFLIFSESDIRDNFDTHEVIGYVITDTRCEKIKIYFIHVSHILPTHMRVRFHVELLRQLFFLRTVHHDAS